MLFYVRMDISGGINVNKTNESHKCFIYDYYYIIF